MTLASLIMFDVFMSFVCQNDRKRSNIKTACSTFLEGLTRFKILCFKATIYQIVNNDMIVKTFNKFQAHRTCYMCVRALFNNEWSCW